MSDDVLITPASRKIEFKDNAGNVDGKIELDANGNLNITSPGGDIGLGDATADVFIGDGTNNVDIVFEQDGEIRALTGRTLTIGQSDSDVTVTAQNFDVTDGMTLDGGTLILGDDAYSVNGSYVGMKTSAMSGSQDYMIISGHSGVDTNTYISAKADSDVYIRGGGNVSTPQIQMDTSAGDIVMTGDASISGSLTAGGLSYPTSDGTNGQVLTTNGSGTLSFSSSSGGISNVVEDTTPQLGGTLDANGENIEFGDASYLDQSLNTLKFGASGDFSLQHDGNNSWIREQGTGNLLFQSNAGLVQFQTDNDGVMLKMTVGGSVMLLYDGAITLETYNNGIEITGSITTLGRGGNTNTLVGYQAGDNLTYTTGGVSNLSSAGTNNVAIGKEALKAMSTGDDNTAVGTGTAPQLTGNNNTIIGSTSALNAQAAFDNVVVGKNCGPYFAGGQNVYVGNNTGVNVTTSYNTFVGYGAGQQMTTGAKNVILGNYNGNENSFDLRTSSNNIVFSDGDGNVRQHINSSGFVGIGKVNPGAMIDVKSSGSNTQIAGFDSSLSGAGAFDIREGLNGEVFLQGINSSGTETIRLRPNSASDSFLNIGNLGIGNTSPSYKLDVTGDINFTGTLRQNGTAVESAPTPNYNSNTGSTSSSGSSGNFNVTSTTITPSSTSSRILVIATYRVSDGGNPASFTSRIKRGSTDLGVGLGTNLHNYGQTEAVSNVVIDHPNSTSQQTYNANISWSGGSSPSSSASIVAIEIH